jgi:hypothetical protein
LLVGAIDLRAGFDEALGEGRTHGTSALDRHGAPLAAVVAKHPAQRRAHAEEHAVGRVRRRVAAAAVLAFEARHVLGRAADDLEVLDRRVDVLGGDVLATDRFDEPPHREVERLGLDLLRVPDHDRLAAAEPRVGHRRLEGHAARQALHIEQGLLFGGVGPHAEATQRRAEGGVVHGDDRVQATGGVDAADDAFVAGNGDIGDLEGLGHGSLEGRPQRRARMIEVAGCWRHAPKDGVPR